MTNTWMLLIITTLTIITTTDMNPLLLFDFDKNSDLINWQMVNDGVMGGLSGGTLQLNEEGHGVFAGKISLENNGGFSSVRYYMNPLATKDYKKISIRLKGDGKKYQFRVKRKSSDYYSYIGYFTTSGEWETIEITLSDLYPSFRGRKLDMENFSGDSMEELGFLFGNKKAEEFQLEIDTMMLLIE